MCVWEVHFSLTVRQSISSTLLFALTHAHASSLVSYRARLLIVMEMMEGGELFHRISQHRHFTEKMASQVTKQVSEDLQYTKTDSIYFLAL